MKGGLALLLSKGPPKGGSDEEEKDDYAPESKEEASMEDEFLSDAFNALKSDDLDGFKEALKNWKGC